MNSIDPAKHRDLKGIENNPPKFFQTRTKHSNGTSLSEFLKKEQQPNKAVRKEKKYRNCKLNPKSLVAAFRIMNGKAEVEHRHPYHVGLVETNNGLEPNVACGGAIICPKFVITANHCTEDYKNNVTAFQVLVGTHYSSMYTNSNLINVKRIIPHPQAQSFESGLNHYDFSILELEHALVFSAKIRPIHLPSYSATPKNYTEQIFQLTGWGINLQQNEDASKELQVVNLKYVPFEKCDTLDPRRNPQIPANISLDDKMCTKAADPYFISGQDACRGDSGGKYFQ